MKVTVAIIVFPRNARTKVKVETLHVQSPLFVRFSSLWSLKKRFKSNDLLHQLEFTYLKYRKFDKVTQAPSKQSMVHYQVNVIDQPFFTSAYLNFEHSFIDCINNVQVTSDDELPRNYHFALSQKHLDI